MIIVFATDQYWPRISGVSVSIETFRYELEKMGHEVFIMAPQYEKITENSLVTKGGKTFRFKSHGVFFSPEDKIVRYSEKEHIDSCLDRIQPDIIHVQTEFTVGKIVSSYARKHGIPLIMSAHTNWEELINLYLPFFPKRLARVYTRKRMQTMYNYADTIIVPTSPMQSLLTKYNVTSPMEIIPTGIREEDFHITTEERVDAKTEWINKFPQLAGKKIIITAGRIGKEKNIPFLLDVVNKLAAQNSDTMLVIVGDGPFKKELENIVAEKKLTSKVVFTGALPRKKMKSILSIAKVFVFASRVESQGMVVLEAMISKLPVVAIGEMGTKEVMGGDVGGFMVSANLDEFTARVADLLNNSNLYQQKKDEAYAHAQLWLNESNALKLLQIYKKYAQLTIAEDYKAASSSL